MEDFKWYYNNFISQMHTTAYRELQESDMKWHESTNYLDKNSARFEQVLDSLNEDDKNFVEEYMRHKVFEDASASENMYIAGYRDCVKLLREIGMI